MTVLYSTAALLAMLMRNSEDKKNPLLVASLLSMLESTLQTGANTTPRELARKMVTLLIFSFSEKIPRTCCICLRYLKNRVVMVMLLTEIFIAFQIL